MLKRSASLGQITFVVILSCSEVFKGSFAATLTRSLTRDLSCLPGNVFVDPSAPDEPTALVSFFRRVYARSPAAAIGEPILSGRRKPSVRIDETIRKTHSFTTLQPEIN